MKKNQENTLLNTPIDKLGLGPLVGRWFTQTECGQPLQIPAMTIAQFFKANNRFVGVGEKFVCSNQGDLGFTQSTSFKKLRTFFLDAGFSHKDWVMLLPKSNRKYRFSLLSKEQIMTLPFYQICGLKHNTPSFEALAGILVGPANDGRNAKQLQVSVRELLTITRAHLHQVFFGGEQPMDYGEVQTLIQLVHTAQKKLQMLGFSAKDGPFMSVSFKRENSPVRFMKIIRNQGEQVLLFPEKGERKIPLRVAKATGT